MRFSKLSLERQLTHRQILARPRLTDATTRPQARDRTRMLSIAALKMFPLGRRPSDDAGRSLQLRAVQPEHCARHST